MIRTGVNLDEVISFLNELVLVDQAAMQALVDNRVMCNDAMMDHPTVQCGHQRVGMLGILNGIFGVDERSYGPIAAVYDDHGTLLNFERLRAQVT